MAELNDLLGEEQRIITLDDITGQFSQRTQRQSYYEPEPDGGTDGLDPSLTDPDGDATNDAVWSPDDERHEVSPERAHRTGERIARVIDTGFNFIASNLIAKDSGKDYKASEKDLDDIAQAWGDIAEDRKWEFSPAWQLVILYAIVYGPLAKEALNDRRVMEIERRQEQQDEKIKLMQYELDNIRRQNASQGEATRTDA